MSAKAGLLMCGRGLAGAAANVQAAGTCSPSATPLASRPGTAPPDAMQRLLDHAGWDADAVHDELREYVRPEFRRR